MARGLFITGTDTNVGKTVLSAAILHRFRGIVPLRYWKPIQTGTEQDDDTATVRWLGACPPEEIRHEGIRLPQPVSPHLAARWIGATIEIAPLAAQSAGLPDDTSWIFEGAGGVLVPLNDHQTMIDLIATLGLGALIAARTSLGTINHTLLTVEALRHRDIPIAGVVLIGPHNADVREAIESYGRVTVVGEMPPFVPLTPEAVGTWSPRLDPDGILMRWLG